MAKTGFLVEIYQDVNPSSPTYNQTREERTQSEEFCPTSAEANWIEDTKYCELTENGMLTGYEITVYRDVEPLSSTYYQTREERELNPTECEADETTPNWQNIGDPFCRQKVYMPGGLMGNDGYMIQQQQDMNEYSETADEIREIETLDLTNCPLPNTLPEWEVIYEACHIIKQDGQLMFDGTKDVVRIDRNQYSPSWNDNVPETVNVEDLVNCPPDIDVQYRWVGVSGEFMCVGYDKHSVEKKQRTTDGETWVDVMPLQTRAGELIEANSEDCGYEPTIEYRWVVVDEQYICVGIDKHAMEKKQQSVDGGEWTDVTPLETRAGELLEENSEDCGYQPTFEYRWVVITGQYECVGYDKYAVEKKQQSSDGGQNWTDVEPLQTRTGSLIERNSTDCGYLEPQYRWVAISDAFVCVGYDKHQQEKQQVSYDNGTTWEDVVPANTRTGSLIEHNSDDCGYVPETVYRWVTISDGYMCVGFDKYTTEKKQQSVDGGTTWTDVVPTETRAGELVEANSEYCGYTDYTTFDCGILFTDKYDRYFSTNSGARFELLSTQVNNANGYIRVNFRIHIKKIMDTYMWVVRGDGGIEASRYIGDVVEGQVITDYFEVPCGSYTFHLMIHEWISDYYNEYAVSNLAYICNDCSETPVYTTRWVVDNIEYLCNGVDKHTLEREQYFEDDEWWYTSKEREGVLFESDSLDCGGTGNIYEKQYLRTTALEDGTIVFYAPNLFKEHYIHSNVYYSTDNGETWNTNGVIDSDGNETTTVKVTTGQSVLWKCTAGRMGIIDDSRYCNFGGTARFNVDGNIMSMLEGDNFVGSTVGSATTNTHYVFAKMFKDSKVVDASNLIMLKSVTTNGCYSYMFYGCKDLTVPPELPARALADSCYDHMFYGCTDLRMSPVLPAEMLVDNCYKCMLTYCSNIIYIKALFTTTPGIDYTDDWVYGVASSGTFVKNENATWDVIGVDGVPTSWVIQYTDDVPPVPMQHRWITDTETYKCLGYNKYSVEKRQQSVDGGNTWTDVVPTETRTGSLIESYSEDCGFVPYMNTYLTVESLEDNNDITFARSYAAPYDLERTIYVSTDNGAIWTSKSSSEYSTPTVLATLNTGDKLLIKGTNDSYGTTDSDGNVISSTKKINVYGNIMSLVYGDDFIGKTVIGSAAFVKMFCRNANLVSAENLILPTNKLKEYCYYGMFMSCSSLTTAPALPAKTLATSCYEYMFNGCSSLVNAPELPATTLESDCYKNMLKSCSSLNYIKAMFTTTPGKIFTSEWVKGVASSGTFVKNKNATWNVTGVNGVPNGWTIQKQ